MRVEKLHILLEFITIIKHCVLFGSRSSMESTAGESMLMERIQTLL